MPLSYVPNSFLSCMMELLARNRWCTELRWRWCSLCSSSTSLSSMADDDAAGLSTPRAGLGGAILDDGNMVWGRGEESGRRELVLKKGRGRRVIK